MAIRLKCPECQRPFQLPDANAGLKLLCHCGGTIQAPPAGARSVDRSWPSAATASRRKREKEREQEIEAEKAEEALNVWPMIQQTLTGAAALLVMVVAGGCLWGIVSRDPGRRAASGALNQTARPGPPGFSPTDLPGLVPNTGLPNLPAPTTNDAFPQSVELDHFGAGPRGVTNEPLRHRPQLQPPPPVPFGGQPEAFSQFPGGKAETGGSSATDVNDDFGSGRPVPKRGRRPAPSGSVLGTPPVATVVVDRLGDLKRGMKVWHHDGGWKQAVVAGRSDQDLMLLKNDPQTGMNIVPAVLANLRFEERELDRDDLEEVPILGTEPNLVVEDFGARILELQPPEPKLPPKDSGNGKPARDKKKKKPAAQR